MQTRVTNKYSDKPYGTWREPTLEEQIAERAGIAGGFMGGVSGTASTLSDHYFGDNGTQLPPNANANDIANNATTNGDINGTEQTTPGQTTEVSNTVESPTVGEMREAITEYYSDALNNNRLSMDELALFQKVLNSGDNAQIANLYNRLGLSTPVAEELKQEQRIQSVPLLTSSNQPIALLPAPRPSQTQTIESDIIEDVAEQSKRSGLLGNGFNLKRALNNYNEQETQRRLNAIVLGEQPGNTADIILPNANKGNNTLILPGQQTQQQTQRQQNPFHVNANTSPVFRKAMIEGNLDAAIDEAERMQDYNTADTLRARKAILADLPVRGGERITTPEETQEIMQTGGLLSPAQLNAALKVANANAAIEDFQAREEALRQNQPAPTVRKYHFDGTRQPALEEAIPAGNAPIATQETTTQEETAQENGRNKRQLNPMRGMYDTASNAFREFKDASEHLIAGYEAGYVGRDEAEEMLREWHRNISANLTSKKNASAFNRLLNTTVDKLNAAKQTQPQAEQNEQTQPQANETIEDSAVNRINDIREFYNDRKDEYRTFELDELEARRKRYINERIKYYNDNPGGQGVTSILLDENGQQLGTEGAGLNAVRRESVSNNPEWYQKAYALLGRKTAKKDYEYIAEVDLSEWQPAEVQADWQALNEVIEEKKNNEQIKAEPKQAQAFRKNINQKVRDYKKKLKDAKDKEVSRDNYLAKIKEMRDNALRVTTQDEVKATVEEAYNNAVGEINRVYDDVTSQNNETTSQQEPSTVASNTANSIDETSQDTVETSQNTAQAKSAQNEAVASEATTEEAQTKKAATKDGQENNVEASNSSNETAIEDVEAVKKSLVNLAEEALKNKSAHNRVSFKPSQKLQNKINELFGHDIKEIFITSDSIRHLRNHHGEGEEKRGQVNFTPNMAGEIYDTVNDFDEATRQRDDNKGNKNILVLKKGNGDSFALLVERGKKKAEIKTFYKKTETSPMFDAKSPNLNAHSDSAKSLNVDSNITQNEPTSKDKNSTKQDTEQQERSQNEDAFSNGERAEEENEPKFSVDLSGKQEKSPIDKEATTGDNKFIEDNLTEHPQVSTIAEEYLGRISNNKAFIDNITPNDDVDSLCDKLVADIKEKIERLLNVFRVDKNSKQKAFRLNLAAECIGVLDKFRRDFYEGEGLCKSFCRLPIVQGRARRGSNLEKSIRARIDEGIKPNVKTVGNERREFSATDGFSEANQPLVDKIRETSKQLNTKPSKHSKQSAFSSPKITEADLKKPLTAFSVEMIESLTLSQIETVVNSHETLNKAISQALNKGRKLAEATEKDISNIHTIIKAMRDSEIKGSTKNSANGKRLEKLLKTRRFLDGKELTDKQRELQKLGDELGAPIIFFTADSALRGYHVGGVSFVNVRGNKNLEWTFWHEATHFMKAENKDLFNQLIKDVAGKEGFSSKQLDEYRAKTGRFNLSDEKVIEEMIADALADNRNRISFLRNIGKENKSLAERVIAYLKGLMDKFAEFLHNPKGGLTTEQRARLRENFAKIANNIVDADGKKIFSVKRGKGSEFTLTRADGTAIPAYSFAGEHAKTANVEALNRAKVMENAGESAENIYKSTGWIKGKDDKWRFEIPDNLDKIDFSELSKKENWYGERAFPLNQIYDNEELYRAYPDLRDIQVAAAGLEKNEGGSYSPFFEMIDLNQNDIVSDPEQAKRALIHEIQHVIQEYENFARGGNPESVKEQIKAELDNLNIGLERNNAEYVKLRKSVNEKMDKWLDTYSGEDEKAVEDAQKKLKEYADNLPKGEEEKIKNTLGRIRELKRAINKSVGKFTLYERLGGEQEAREAGSRAISQVNIETEEKRLSSARKKLIAMRKELSPQDTQRLNEYFAAREKTKSVDGKTNKQEKYKLIKAEHAILFSLPQEIQKIISEINISRVALNYYEGQKATPQIHDEDAIIVFGGEEFALMENREESPIENSDNRGDNKRNRRYSLSAADENLVRTGLTDIVKGKDGKEHIVERRTNRVSEDGDIEEFFYKPSPLEEPEERYERRLQELERLDVRFDEGVSDNRYVNYIGKDRRRYIQNLIDEEGHSLDDIVSGFHEEFAIALKTNNVRNEKNTIKRLLVLKGGIAYAKEYVGGQIDERGNQPILGDALLGRRRNTPTEMGEKSEGVSRELKQNRIRPTSRAEMGGFSNARSVEELKAEVKEAFPNATKVEETKSGVILTMPNGMKMTVSIKDEITASEEELADARRAHNISSDIKVTIEGYAETVDGGAFVALSQGSRNGTGFHEAYHVAEDLVFTDKEKKDAKRLISENDEERADAYAEWKVSRGKKQSNFAKLWRKISDFAARMASLAGFETKSGLFQKIESGEMYEREGNVARNSGRRYSATSETDPTSNETLWQKVKNVFTSDSGKRTQYRQQMAKTLEDALGVKIRYGKMDESKGAAVYKEKDKVIRSKHAYDWENILPVAGGVVSEKLGIVPKAEDATEAQRNIFANWMLEGTLNDSPEARAFEEAMKKTLNAAVKTRLENARRNFQKWQDKESDERMQECIQEQKEHKGKSLKEWREHIYNEVVEEFAPIQRLVDAYEEQTGKKLSISINPMVAFRLLRGQGERVLAMVNGETKLAVKALQARYPAVDWTNFKTVKDIIGSIGAYQDKEKQRDFATYCVACHMLDLHDFNENLEVEKRMAKEDVEALQTQIDTTQDANYKEALQAELKDAEEKLKNLEAQKPYTIHDDFTREKCENYIEKRKKEYGEAQRDLVNYSNVLMQILYDSGYISGKHYKTMANKWKNYVPMYRVFEENEEIDFGDSLMRFNGSKRDIVNPIESIIHNTAVYIKKAERNKAVRVLADFARCDNSGWLAEEVDNRDPNTRTQVTFRENGKVKYIELGDPAIAKAINKMDLDSKNLILELCHAVTAIARASFTTANPEFLIRNPLRDSADAFLYDGVYPWDVFRGFMHALRKDATYYDWMTSGAAQSSLVSLDRDYTQEIKESMGANWKSRLLSKQFLPTILQGIQKMSEFSEYATRIAVYKKRKAEYEKAGMDARDAVLSAALRSRDLIDFGRHGKTGASYNKLVPFANASIQGLDKFYRELIEPKGWREDTKGRAKTLFRLSLTAILPTMLMGLVWGDDDWYKKRCPNWVKDTHWVLPLGKDSVIRIPKGADVGIRFFSNAFQKLMDDNPHKFKEYFAPIVEAMPGIGVAIAKPAVEVMFNKNSFTGADIVPKYQLDTLTEAMQYSAYTTGFSKWLGEKLDVAPRKIDHLIAGYTGTPGMFIPKTVDVLMGNQQLSTSKEDLPISRALLYPKYKNSQMVQDFYDELDRQKKFENEYKDTKKKPEGFDPKKLKRMKDANNKLKKLNEKENAAIENPKLSYDKRKEIVASIYNERNKLVEKALKK